MAKLARNQIRHLALQLIAQNPQGIRFSELLRQISALHPQTNANTISGSTYNLVSLFPQQVTKPSKGLFVSVSAANSTLNNTSSTATSPPASSAQLLEKDFYQPFAVFLQGELNEVTVAAPLGGAGLGSKWGTPDVIGVYKPLPTDRISFDKEVVSAEIKINPLEAVTAFGQAMAYRLFSTKVYIVMPNTISKNDQNRLEALCMLFGAGFVTFDLNPTAPSFNARIRSQRSVPDMFYVNAFADGLFNHDAKLFSKLF